MQTTNTNHVGIIAVIGGAGKSGQYLISELSKQNIPFRQLLRPHRRTLYTQESDNQHAKANPQAADNIVYGDARDPDTILRLCEGCHAIISTLGQPKGEPAIFSQATRNVLSAMRIHKIKRYILTTGLNVDTPQDKKGPAAQAATRWMHQHYPETTTDKQLEYQLLAQSNNHVNRRASGAGYDSRSDHNQNNDGIDWTLVRLPLIGQTDETAPVATSLEDCPGRGINAIDLARFLISQLKDTQFIRQAPFLANI